MNPRFRELPEEKQLRILNAAMEVFAQNDYKKASTDLIAAKAEVSKGPLFYYFRNKKELYFSVYEYAIETATACVVSEELFRITDFYELLLRAASDKIKLMQKHPYIMEFCIRAYYSDKEEVSGELKASLSQASGEIYGKFFSGIDLTKFKPGVDPAQIYRMLAWMTDGYLHDRQMQGLPICAEELGREFRTWVQLLKKSTYKEEYQ